jgi:hypothetical protein
MYGLNKWLCLAAVFVCFGLFCYRVYVLSTLSDFELNSASPLDLASDLNAHVKHEVYAEILLVVLVILKQSRSKISILLCSALLLWTFYTFRTGKFWYKPIHVVRDMWRHQVECVVRIIIVLGAMVCAVANFILSFL